jgi:UDP-glucuronate 4-epimerase
MHKSSDLEHRTSYLEPKTHLLTGGAGFIGSHLTNKLLARGDRVIVIDEFNDYYDPQIKRNNIAHHQSNPLFHLYEGDILDSKFVEEVMDKHQPQCVVHLAARAGVRPSLANPKLYYDVNVMGMLNILEAMKQNDIKQLVFASSSSVYGNRSTGPFKETDATDAQVSPYGASKKAGELLCHTYAHLYGIKTTCLRFFTVFGPRNRPDMACSLFAHAILQNKPITMFGDGSTGRDYTFVDDTVAGIIAAIDKPFTFEVINLGNASPVLLKDLIAAIETEANKKATIIPGEQQPGDVQLTFADISKAKTLLGWEPTTKLEDGVRKLLEWHEQC